VAYGQSCISNTIVVDSPAYEAAKVACARRLFDQPVSERAPVPQDRSRDLLASQLIEFRDGCTIIGRGDDGGQELTSTGFNFRFGATTYDTFFVNINGLVTFGGGYSNYIPASLANVGLANISPFWSDVDTSDGCSGPLSVCISQDAASADTMAVTAAAQAAGVPFTATKSFAATWSAVGRYAYTSCDLLNSFQVVLAVDAAGKSLIMFNYGDMQFTSGGSYYYHILHV
jgi:hypothetical protein